MSMVTVFGVCAVGFMMLMYALEHRHPRFILGFAIGCLLSSAYGFPAPGRLAWSRRSGRSWRCGGSTRPGDRVPCVKRDGSPAPWPGAPELRLRVVWPGGSPGPDHPWPAGGPPLVAYRGSRPPVGQKAR